MTIPLKWQIGDRCRFPIKINISTLSDKHARFALDYKVGIIEYVADDGALVSYDNSMKYAIVAIEELDMVIPNGEG